MSSAKPGQALMLEALGDRIAADPAVAATRKKSVQTSIRCFGRVLGLDPARMPADVAAYREAVARVRPARHASRRAAGRTS